MPEIQFPWTGTAEVPISPARKRPSPMQKVGLVYLEGARNRFNSSRSPTIVRTRKPIHQWTICGMALPVSQRALPTNQAPAPRPIVQVNRVGCFTMMRTKIETSPRPPNVIRSIPGLAGRPTANSSEPMPARNGAMYPHHLPSATDLSTQMSVPRKPQTMKGPWSRVSLDCSHVAFHPKRTSPVHRARSKKSSDMMRSENRVRWLSLAIVHHDPLDGPKNASREQKC